MTDDDEWEWAVEAEPERLDGPRSVEAVLGCAALREMLKRLARSRQVCERAAEGTHTPAPVPAKGRRGARAAGAAPAAKRKRGAAGAAGAEEAAEEAAAAAEGVEPKPRGRKRKVDDAGKPGGGDGGA